MSYRLARFAPQQRIQFDPANKSHRDIVKDFLITGSWKYCCPFYLEDPYTNIRSMITEKLARYVVDLDNVS